MREVHINELITKYKTGLTSIKDEELLFNNIPENDERLQQIASFKESQKVKVPENLNEKLWVDFEEKITQKKSTPIYKWSAVASVLLILALYLNYGYQKNQEELKKQALLEEAKSMFAETNEPLKMNKILFEDETLIVYTKTEN